MKNTIIYIAVLFVLLIAPACDDQYLDRLPLDSPSSETFFANETELEMDVPGVYDRLM